MCAMWRCTLFVVMVLLVTSRTANIPRYDEDSTRNMSRLRVFVDSSFFGECFTFTNETVRDLISVANRELQCREECEIVSDGRDADLIVTPAHKVGVGTDLYGATWEEGVIPLNETTQRFVLAYV